VHKYVVAEMLYLLKRGQSMECRPGFPNRRKDIVTMDAQELYCARSRRGASWHCCLGCEVVHIAAYCLNRTVRPKPGLTMRHDRIRANMFGSALPILILSLGVATAQSISLNHSVVEETGWGLKSGGYSVAVRVY
jgi:hypothetical protein